MKELHAEGVATHSDPESWIDGRKDIVQALTGAPLGPGYLTNIMALRNLPAIQEPPDRTATPWR